MDESYRKATQFLNLEEANVSVGRDGENQLSELLKVMLQ